MGSCDALLRYLAKKKEMEGRKDQGEDWVMSRKTGIYDISNDVTPVQACCRGKGSKMIDI